MSVQCPFCGSGDIEIVSPWGGQIITCQARCGTCHTYFEAIREEFAGAREAVGGPEPAGVPETVSSWTTSSAGDR